MRATKATTDSEIQAILNSNVAAIILNENLCILRANQQCQPLFSCHNDLLIGQHIADIFKLHRADFPYSALELSQSNETFKKFISTFRLCNQPDKKINWKLQLFQTSLTLYVLTASLETPFKLVTNDSAPQAFSQNVVELIGSTIQQTQNQPSFFSTISTIIHALPGYAHLKSSTGFIYQAANHATLKLLGMRQANELVGKNDYDVAKLMSWKWPSHFAQEIQDYDARVITEKTSIVALEEKPYLNSEGNLVMNSLTKIPLYSANEAFGILTFAIDISHLKSIFDIRNLYKRLYADPEQGHQKFLHYLGLPSVLHENQSVTEKEYEILLAYCRGISAKLFAREFGLSPRTVEKRLEIIKDKFIKFDKNQVIDLILLRGHKEIISS
jgi:DNA-binding CsgD family transcriptional regulator